MAQARRKSAAAKPKRGQGRRNPASIGMLLAGAALGSLGTILWQGARVDDGGIGAGIRQLFGERRPAIEQQSGAASPQSSPKLSTDYDFFTVLPEIEVMATAAQHVAVKPPENDRAAPSNAHANTRPQTSAATRPSAFMLQAASYRRRAEAERLKANLAFSGMISAIQKASIQDEGDFYRVRLGPYATFEAMEQVNRRLSALGIKALPLKIVTSGQPQASD